MEYIQVQDMIHERNCVHDEEVIKQRRAERRRKRRQRELRIKLTVFAVMASVLLLVILGGVWVLRFLFTGKDSMLSLEGGVQSKKEEAFYDSWYEKEVPKPAMTQEFLSPNEYSRPGEPLQKINKIFVHYTANPGTSAAQNRSYFESLALTKETSASSHFIIGYEGEMIQCLPLNEIGYAVKENNYDSVSIECCYIDDNGEFTEQTYESLVTLTTWLLHEYKLTVNDIYRHYDAGGKACPKYYVENEAEWEQFLQDVKTGLETSVKRAEGE